LRNAIVSLQRLNYPNGQYEIIVIDNNSTDATPCVVEECDKQGKEEIVYHKELRDGLHNARHAGAQIAKGDILAYIDDDVVCDPEWLSELTRPYTDPKVACVGGKILPRYETREPEWARYFPHFLSILDRANEIKKVNDAGIWGCNFSIRKSVLYDVGGFHPDAMPWGLIRCRGDGETGLLNKVVESEYDVVYTPFASVTHIIPKERVTLDYFRKRAFIEGITESYIAIRKNRGMLDLKKRLGFLDSAISGLSEYAAFGKAVYSAGLRYAIYEAIDRRYHKKGVLYHRANVSNDPKLLEFILRENYFHRNM
jgi:glycosyltransferase involved in cell wall biosynthesis